MTKYSELCLKSFFAENAKTYFSCPTPDCENVVDVSEWNGR